MMHFDIEMKEAGDSSDEEKIYELPDGNIITVSLPVSAFQPMWLGC